jgi:hypothetical protein
LLLTPCIRPSALKGSYKRLHLAAAVGSSCGVHQTFADMQHENKSKNDPMEKPE